MAISSSLFSWHIICHFTGFEAVLKRFQRVSAGGGVPLEKKSRFKPTSLDFYLFNDLMVGALPLLLPSLSIQYWRRQLKISACRR